MKIRNDKSPRGNSTTSIDERTGAPIVSSEMPYSFRISACPSAVAPPWLPIAGTTNGCAPRVLQVVAHFSDEQREVVDPTAAGGDGDAGAGTNDGVERRQLRSQRAAWIVEMRAIEPLPDFEELTPPHMALKYRDQA